MPKGLPAASQQRVRVEDRVRTLPWPGDDHSLVAGLRQGSVAAAAALYDRFADDVRRLTRRVLGPDRDHEDMVQQVFVNAFAHANKIRDPAALQSWLVSVALNTNRQEIRRRRLYRRYFASADSPPAVETHQDPVARDALQRTYRALDRLKADERIAFVLCYLSGWTQEQISSHCGCSVPTVKRRLKRARQRFERVARQDAVLAERLSTGIRFGAQS